MPHDEVEADVQELVDDDDKRVPRLPCALATVLQSRSRGLILSL